MSDFSFEDHITTDVSSETSVSSTDDSDPDEERYTAVDRNDFDRSGYDQPLPHRELVYADESGSNTADDVDPRLLHHEPTIDEIRWQARMNPIANTIVEKPIKDAFKNGFELTPAHDDVDEDALDELREYFDEWVDYFRLAEIKARRDGAAAVFFKVRDGTTVHESPDEVQELAGMEVITLDDLTNGGINEYRILETVEFIDPTEDRLINIHITPDGFLVYRNIQSPHNRELIGYAYQENNSPDQAQFIHADRTQHLVWNHKNDGELNEFTVGHVQGDSVLLPIWIPLKSLAVTDWAMGQAVFRYSAPLYVAETPMEYGQEEFDDVSDQMQNLNSASDVTLPPGVEMDAIGNEGVLDPSPFVDKLIEQACAGSEFTKSVLMGTQTGTVSGSATDIKNYFNQVQRYRTNRAEARMADFVSMLNEWGLTDVTWDDIEIEWGPLFKLDDMDRMEAMVRVVTATSNAIDNYLLDPEEAREVLQAEWAALDIDVDLDGLDEEQMELFREVNGESAGIGDNPDNDHPDEDVEGNPRRGQNGGGMERGQTTDPDDPTA